MASNEVFSFLKHFIYFMNAENWSQWKSIPSTIFFCKSIVWEISCFKIISTNQIIDFLIASQFTKFPKRNWWISLMLVISNSEKDVRFFTYGKSNIPRLSVCQLFVLKSIWSQVNWIKRIPWIYYYFEPTKLRVSWIDSISSDIWNKVFKSGLSKFFKGWLPQNLFSSLLNTLSHLEDQFSCLWQEA